MQEKIKIVIEQCNAATSIVKRLLAFSKPSKKEFARININHTVKAVITLVEHQFQGSHIVINTHFSDKLLYVNADEKQLQEVFMNLLRNAEEAMPEGGQIDLHTFEKEGNIYIDCKDTGEGISEEAIKKIFDPFFTTKEKGTGLGLSVCYGIIKAHNGDLQLFSKKAEGATARVILPIN